MSAISQPKLWFSLGILDIKLKYRRSLLGPWWEAISVLIVIIALGFLWSNIFKINIKEYLPYFSIGFCFWSFLSSQLNESSEILFFHQNIISNISLPFFSYVLRLLTKNTIIFFHYLAILIPLIYIYNGISIVYLLSFLGFFILMINLVLLSLIISIFCLRFHDTKYIISNVLQVLFFLTPIVWMPNLFDNKKFFLVEFNPIFHWLNLIREPVINNLIPIDSLFISLASILFFSLISFYIIGRSKKRLPFWF